MSVLDKIIYNEKPEEVVLFFTKNELGISLPQLDRLYNVAGWAHVGDNIGLLNLLWEMRVAGFIENNGARITRGVNWREPAFMLEGKYTFD
ncbi:hypothetical protein PS918_00364 [Pseudomonas fluorescens]|uniref:Uncharacterized protein n=1 Tax=Pseudomonas fluorescens TaxID=294 RepID=A0A5E7QWX5_PSEFL|nr:hypothetical protein [Pseudomonas fluorescens]VVP66389.1 hypothetical protein PS918_00364 [Pseudomonas fluorescens]